MRLRNLLLLAAMGLPLDALAVEMNGGFTTTVPTVAGWDSGWNPADPSEQTYNPNTGAGYTGWDYVGTVDNASGVYLGDDWVLTADHVSGTAAAIPGGADFTIGTGPGAGTYLNTGQYETFPNQGETTPVDLVLVKIADPTGTLANLPTLTLASSPPQDYLNNGTGSTVVMIGYGNQIRNPTVNTTPRPAAKTWGVDTVTLNSQETPLPYPGPHWDSTDFYTADGTFTANGAAKTQMNDSLLVPGDSGGGDFIFNAATGLWELAGINEGYGTTDVYYDTTKHRYEHTTDPNVPGQELDFSAEVEISDYVANINTVTGVPEPSAWVLAALGALALGGWSRLRSRLSF